MTAVLLIATLPWLAVAAAAAFAVWVPPPLRSPDMPPSADRQPSSVRIVVPARNEAENIGPCLRSLTLQDYPDFRITVVDDCSTDGTGRIARSIAPGHARSVEVLDGAPLPPGWFGKSWACAQGARGATECLLLFTDADTLHGPSLLALAVRALAEDEASALTLFGKQELVSFGERLVQPHLFTLLGLRFRNVGSPLGPERQGDAVANGQYILVRRSAYDEIGGHVSLRSEVVEDLRFAQRLTGAGHRLSLRTAGEGLSTRMYHSLREVLDGWTKNLAIGASQSAGPLGRLALVAIMGYTVVAWVLPPAVFVLLVAAGTLNAWWPGGVLLWSGAATLAGFLAWVRVYGRSGVPRRYALLFPLGAAALAHITLRSAWRGHRRVEWKGRRYSGGEALGESG
ncbi:MAG: glycosyltransferase [Gammaproteobacteria bacterium]|nr:glycosyltransferase [Gammaproteobacteria bacterium]MDE0246546.1 glycosyltransferase [Gammaproteobacteria bacterium]